MLTEWRALWPAGLVTVQSPGEMIGWLSEWGVSRNTPTPMDWMPASAGGMAGMSMADMPSMRNGLMPGMATAAQMDELLHAHGKHLDVLFLQLMIRHHQGGRQMADYAAAHAAVPAVRELARTIGETQAAETRTMGQMLSARGGTPLPPA